MGTTNLFKIWKDKGIDEEGTSIVNDVPDDFQNFQAKTGGEVVSLAITAGPEIGPQLAVEIEKHPLQGDGSRYRMPFQAVARS